MTSQCYIYSHGEKFTKHYVGRRAGNRGFTLIDLSVDLLLEHWLGLTMTVYITLKHALNCLIGVVNVA